MSIENSAPPGLIGPLDCLLGATTVMKTGTLTTTATTADQVILTYTVTAGKTLFLCYLTHNARWTVLQTSGAVLGYCSVESPSGTKVFTNTCTGPSTGEAEATVITPSNPLPFAPGTVIRFVCTPWMSTSTVWVANFGGFEI